MSSTHADFHLSLMRKQNYNIRLNARRCWFEAFCPKSLRLRLSFCLSIILSLQLSSPSGRRTCNYLPSASSWSTGVPTPFAQTLQHILYPAKEWSNLCRASLQSAVRIPHVRFFPFRLSFNVRRCVWWLSRLNYACMLEMPRLAYGNIVYFASETTMTRHARRLHRRQLVGRLVLCVEYYIPFGKLPKTPPSLPPVWPPYVHVLWVTLPEFGRLANVTNARAAQRCPNIIYVYIDRYGQCAA